MLFDICTIFPDLFSSVLSEGIIRRALEKKRIGISLHNIRDFATDKHQMTDDRPFGGGEGMVMKPEPLAACLKSFHRQESNSRLILMSPRGTTFTQKEAQRLSSYDCITLICGRYEGVDERFRERYVDEEISIGQYILTGGELAAMVLVDSITRLIPGVLGCEDSASKDTFSRGLLKYPQYTRPRHFEGLDVPEILLSGDHLKIENFRFVESVRETLLKRPDLLTGIEFSQKERKLLKKSGLSELVKQAAEIHDK